MALDGSLWWVERANNRVDVDISNLNTSKQIALAKAKKVKDQSNIHPSAKNYDSIVLECQTKKHHIRIHALKEDKVKYFSWKKDQSISSAPEIALTGIVRTAGSMHNSTYYFKNGSFVYEIMEGFQEDNPEVYPILTITKNGQEITREFCQEISL